ncbi:MAG: HU family DNA-binding protein [Chloroflexi bacterium]|nr:HU family DNA-binding protein [Chloroflexota bacterium]
MYKKDFIKKAATKAEMSEAQMDKALGAIIDSITEALAEGEKVQLTGFGTFSVSERSAREGRNPATGEPIQIPAKKVPSFKAGKSLKDTVNDE